MEINYACKGFSWKRDTNHRDTFYKAETYVIEKKAGWCVYGYYALGLETAILFFSNKKSDCEEFAKNYPQCSTRKVFYDKNNIGSITQMRTDHHKVVIEIGEVKA